MWRNILEFKRGFGPFFLGNILHVQNLIRKVLTRQIWLIRALDGLALSSP